MIKVKLFAVLRELAKREELVLEWSREISCQSVLFYLARDYGLPASILEGCLVAVNGVYSDRQGSLADGDEVAILPPVSGGGGR